MMNVNGIAGLSILAGYALLLWSLARDVRKENRRPRRWWQKHGKKIRPAKRTPSVCPFGGHDWSPVPHQCGGHHTAGGGDCGGF